MLFRRYTQVVLGALADAASAQASAPSAGAAPRLARAAADLIRLCCPAVQNADHLDGSELSDGDPLADGAYPGRSDVEKTVIQAAGRRSSDWENTIRRSGRREDA